MFNTHGIFLNFVQIIYFINPYEINSGIMFIKKSYEFQLQILPIQTNKSLRLIFISFYRKKRDESAILSVIKDQKQYGAQENNVQQFSMTFRYLDDLLHELMINENRKDT